MGPDSQAQPQAQGSSQPQPQSALPARSSTRPVPAFFSASHLGIGGGGASGSGNASASGSGSGSGSGIGGSGGGWLGSGIGGSSKVERAEAKYDVTVDCEWFYASFFLFKCRCGAGLREGKLISFVLIAYRLHRVPPLVAVRSCSIRFKSIQFGPLNLTLNIEPRRQTECDTVRSESGTA
jgi:hypothetical protein